MRFVVVLFLSLTLTTAVYASDLEIVKVKDHIHMLISLKGGNVVVSTGKDGTFLIDDQLTGRSDTILSAAESLGAAKVNFILNTHYHFDHTGGNEFFGSEGAVIISHDNVRRRLTETQFIEYFKKEMAPLKSEGLPVVTLADTMILHYNGDAVQLAHAPAAHTDGDTIAYFKDSDVLVSGDLIFQGSFPFIDIDHGGSVLGLIRGLDMMIDAAGDETVIIPGHGAVMTKGDVIAYRNAIAGIVTKVEADASLGFPVEEIVEAKPAAQFEDTLKDGIVDADTFIGIVYDSLIKGRNKSVK